MSGDYLAEAEEQAARKLAARDAQPELDSGPAPEEITPLAPSLLGDLALRGRVNAPVNAQVMQNMQQTYGNRATQRMLQRKAAGSNTATSVQRQPQATEEGTEAGAVPAAEPSVGTGPNPLTGLKLGDGLNFGTEKLRPRVEQLQNQLRLKNSPIIDIDGMFGQETLHGLNRFQESLNVPQQDVVDDFVASKLMEAEIHMPTRVTAKSIFANLLATGINGVQANGKRIKIVDGPGALLGDAFVTDLEGIENTGQKDITIDIQFLGIVGVTKDGRKLVIDDSKGKLVGTAFFTNNESGEGVNMTLRIDFITLKGKTSSGAPINIADGRGFMLGTAFMHEPNKKPDITPPPLSAPDTGAAPGLAPVTPGGQTPEGGVEEFEET